MFFLEQKTEAAWLLCCVCVPVQKKNCSSGLEEKLQQQVFIQHKKKILIYTAGSGEIFINLFFDLRLDLPIILFTIF